MSAMLKCSVPLPFCLISDRTINWLHSASIFSRDIASTLNRFRRERRFDFFPNQTRDQTTVKSDKQIFTRRKMCLVEKLNLPSYSYRAVSEPSQPAVPE